MIYDIFFPEHSWSTHEEPVRIYKGQPPPPALNGLCEVCEVVKYHSGPFGKSDCR